LHLSQSLSTAPGKADSYILEARLRSVFDQLVVTSVVTIVNSALMTFALERVHLSRGPLIWMGLVWILSAARMVVYSVYKRDPGKSARVRLWQRISVAGALLSGVIWGAGVITLFSNDAVVQWLWIFLIAGMCAGAVSLHSGHLPTALAFVIPASAPMSVFLAAQGTEQWLAAAGMIIVFLFAISLTAGRSSRQFGQMLSLQLVLERRTLELGDANARLNREIEGHRSTAETLRQAQKMEAIGNLTGSIAHDFNNLLTVIVGNLSLIRNRSQDERAVRLAKSGLAAAARGARLTASLLMFARKQALRPELVDINDLIREFAPLLRRAAGDTVKLEMSLWPEPCAARADAAHFQSALLNLVLNARDAMPEGGRIVIHTDTMQQAAADLIGCDALPGRFVRVEVRDNGAGMSPEIAAKAFDPFFTTKAAGKGSGLGLSQVYGFARQSGGFAAIRSEPGEETCVSISLPAWSGDAPRPSRSQTQPPVAAQTPLRVLLVDDDMDVLATLREGLSDLGWDVLIAPDAESALGMVDRYEAIDVLVTDISMPLGMSGTELARAVRLGHPKLPILLMSGFPAAAEGPGLEFDVLQKPLAPEQLAAEISAAAAASRQLFPG
jgi:signal transduction histidine kinase/CheY-like chemotaxis protein